MYLTSCKMTKERGNLFFLHDTHSVRSLFLQTHSNHQDSYFNPEKSAKSSAVSFLKTLNHNIINRLSGLFIPGTTRTPACNEKPLIEQEDESCASFRCRGNRGTKGFKDQCVCVKVERLNVGTDLSTAGGPR